jgi:hypothetical protein
MQDEFCASALTATAHCPCRKDNRLPSQSMPIMQIKACQLRVNKTSPCPICSSSCGNICINRCIVCWISLSIFKWLLLTCDPRALARVVIVIIYLVCGIELGELEFAFIPGEDSLAEATPKQIGRGERNSKHVPKTHTRLCCRARWERRSTQPIPQANLEGLHWCQASKHILPVSYSLSLPYVKKHPGVLPLPVWRPPDPAFPPFRRFARL